MSKNHASREEIGGLSLSITLRHQNLRHRYLSYKFVPIGLILTCRYKIVLGMLSTGIASIYLGILDFSLPLVKQYLKFLAKLNYF